MITLNRDLFLIKWLTTEHRKCHTIKECAAAVGVTESALYAIEAKKRAPGLELYFSMCIWSGLDPCEYMMGVNELVEKSNADFFAKNPHLGINQKNTPKI